MVTSERGSFRLFRAFGINVWMHWSWFLVAAYQLQYRKNSYDSMAWAVAEYVSLFCIVLMHEFGHALACKQTGGSSDEIILWPLGGIAYVRPPNRPGAQLWSLAAGPLVNVALLPVFFVVGFFAAHSGIYDGNPDLRRFLYMVGLINIALLVFNMLPIYPLDGGQILRSLLWFVIGPVRSLYTAVVIGFAGALAMGVYAFIASEIWFGVLAFFAASRCWAGFQQARQMGKIESIPRHREYACPVCREAPFVGPYWVCNQCHAPFDTFETGGVCPQCGAKFDVASCPSCRQQSPRAAWRIAPPPLSTSRGSELF
jgi:Zn-dependent protease